MVTEPKELAEARLRLGQFEADMQGPSALAHLSAGLALLDELKHSDISREYEKTISNITLRYARIVQDEVEALLSREPSVHWDLVEHWRRVFEEFESYGFPLPQEVADTGSKLLMEKLDKEVRLMSPTEREEFLGRMQAAVDRE